MKVCHLCGESYKGCVDFCFNDGEVLKAVDAAGEQPEGASAPAAPHQVQGAQHSHGAVPVTRPRRAAASQPEGDVRTLASAAEPVPAPNVAEDDEAAASPVVRTTPPPELGDDADDDDDVTVPPSSVDTAPLLRPNALRPQQTPAASPMSTAVTPELTSRSLAPAPRAARAMTFDGDDEQNSPSLVMLGIGAAVLGLFFVLGAGAVVVGMSTGVLGPQDPVADVVEPLPDPLSAAPTPPPVEPVHLAPPDPEPAVPTPQPPVQPDPQPPVQPDPQPQPQPQVTAAPPPRPQPQPAPIAQPAPADDGVALAAPEPPLSKLRFLTVPSGASVVIAGKEYGPTPVDVSLPQGEHAYELRLAGFKSHAGSVSASGGAMDMAPVTLTPAAEQPAPAPALTQPDEARRGEILVFASGFAKAEVLMDGLSLGILPAKATDVKEGWHEFTIRTTTGDELQVRHNVSFQGVPDGERVIVQLVQVAGSE